MFHRMGTKSFFLVAAAPGPKIVTFFRPAEFAGMKYVNEYM